MSYKFWEISVHKNGFSQLPVEEKDGVFYHRSGIVCKPDEYSEYYKISDKPLTFEELQEIKNNLK